VSSFQPVLDILPASQRALWPSLAGTRKFGMVLYGGTAIALRLGHRTSVDFDFFKSGDLPSRDAMLEQFPFLTEAKTLQVRLNTLTVLTVPIENAGPVKVSFFGGISFGRVGVPQTTNDGIVEVASFDDLMGTKLKVILQRIEAKDYQDIAAMLRYGVSLERGLASARAMYGPAFQPSEALKALVYFRGGDLDKLSQKDREMLIKAVQNVQDLPQVAIRDSELTCTA
jgi:hypothetical protein